MDLDVVDRSHSGTYCDDAIRLVSTSEPKQ